MVDGPWTFTERPPTPPGSVTVVGSVAVLSAGAVSPGSGKVAEARPPGLIPETATPRSSEVEAPVARVKGVADAVQVTSCPWAVCAAGTHDQGPVSP